MAPLVATTLRDRLAANVQRLRRNLSLTQRELASRAGVSLRQVQKVEARQNTTVNTIEAIAAGLGVDPVVLLRGSEPPPPAKRGRPPVMRLVLGLKR